MVTHFVPAPIAWELKVRYVRGSGPDLRGYAGWKPLALPVIGWAYRTDGTGVDVEAVVSYKGAAEGMLKVLDTLRMDAARRAREQRLTDAGSISFELAPA